jgi:Bacterial Ig domain
MRIELLPTLLFCILVEFPAYADFSFTTPATNTKVKACDDFATQEFNNAWDMSDTADVNNFFPDRDVKNFTNPRFSSGQFIGTTASTSANFYLFSPAVCGSYPIGGRYGPNYTIDTSKYKKLSVRMYTDASDSFGIRTIWDRDCNYASSRSITNASPIKVGWNTYTIDLTTIGIDASSSTNTSAWTAGSITGLAILPTTTTGANIHVDYVRLEDPTSCGSTTTTFNATTTGNNNLYSLWLDSDTNPFNGYVKQLSAGATASGTGNANISTEGMAVGNYYALALLDSDFATLELTNPWDMEDSADISVTANVSNGTFSGGAYSGTTSSTTPTIYLKLPDAGIDASKYNKLSFRLTRSDASTGFYAIWPNGSQYFTTADSVGNDTYQVNLSGVTGWSGTITSLIIRPALASGVNFSLDFVSLRNAGFDTSRSATTLAGSIQTASGFINVNAPPTIEIKQPNLKGGEAFAAWNMNGGDFAQYSNLRADTDTTYSTENYTAYLPDVRSIDGLRGDFFKGTNYDGSFDPVNYSIYPFVSSPQTIDASSYKNLCFKMLTDTAFDLGGGSVARAFWTTDPAIASFNTSEDIVLIYDGWSGSRWYEYCVDMTKLYLDGLTSASWSGTLSAFRVDAHEFTPSTTYYFDYIKLRKDATSKGVYNIVVDLQDSDDTATASLYYTSGNSASGGTLITTLTEGQASYAWDTSGVAAGSYLIYAVTSDGMTSVTRAATGRITISNGGISGTAPILSLQAPSEGQAVCSTLQVKGYALQADRLEDVSTVEVYVDGTLFQLIQPSLYSSAALTAYPSSDSSNSGFNGLFDFSGYANGAHTISVKAISSDGTATTQTFNVTKQSSGCSDPITDSDPSGSPVVIPNVEKPETTNPKIKSIRQDASGNIDLTVTNVGDTECSISIYIGQSSDAVTTLAKSFTVTASQARKRTARYRAAKIKIKNKSLKKIPFKVTKDCEDYRRATSTVKNLKVTTKKGISTIDALSSKLSSKFRAK